MSKLFEPGQIVITAAALDALPRSDIDAALARHLSGDWGEVCPSDWKGNELALPQQSRLFSVYETRAGKTRFWIITEADRSATTILLPDDY